MDSQLELNQKPFVELQIEALIDENQIKQAGVEKFINEFNELLVKLKEINYEKLLNRAFRLPLIGRPNSLNDDYPKGFKFNPPEKVEILGGFKTRTTIEKTKYIDLGVFMPTKCFEKKDIKNQRYHHKRALYLAQLAHLLNGKVGQEIIEKLEFHYHHGNFLKPVLLITPKNPNINHITFQLFANPNSDCPIRVNLLHPSHGNIAPKWFFKDYNFSNIDSEVQEFVKSDSEASASPFYNSDILFDMEMKSNSELLYDQIGSTSSIAKALMLTKIWLYQRDLHQHFSLVVSFFIAYLQTKQNVHQNMSSYQIFRVVVKSIADSKWDVEGLSYYEDSAEKVSAFMNYFPVVFLSPSGNLNLCYNITADLYNRLKHEAELGQKILDKNNHETFELLFLKKLSFINKFDVLVHVPKCTKKLPMKLEYLKKFMDHGVFIPRVYSESVLNLVKKSLTDRVELIQQSSNHLLLDQKWKLRSIPYDPSNEDNTFTLGLLVAPEQSLRIIDIGPDAQSPEAEAYREFWGPKCQLRLQNGVISETVVWHVDSFSQRRAIIKYILTHTLRHADIKNVIVHYTLLERFINLQNVHFKWRSDSNEKVIHEGHAKKRKQENSDDEECRPIGVGEEIYQKVLHGYNELNRVVRYIENMKHNISSIQPMSHHLRGSSIFPPLPVCLQRRHESLKRRKGVSMLPENFDEYSKILQIEPIEMLLTLDSTGKWPGDHESMDAAKLDYLIQLAEALKEKGYTIKLAENYLDVLHGQFVYRIKVKVPKELNFPSNAKISAQKRRLDLEILPKIHAFLDQLHREKTSFGLTCRLVKRWLACQLMTGHLTDIAVDLIVANLYLHPEPYSEPASSLCGFKRFLMLLGSYDWVNSPLVVNFDNQVKMDEINKLKDLMAQDRSKYPPIVICTPFDKEASPWTRQEPNEGKFEILRKICQKALEFLNTEILCNFEVRDECNALFRPNFKLFDLLIKLQPNVVQNFFMRIDVPKSSRLTGKEPDDSVTTSSALRVMPIVDLNVIEEYVKVLRDKYQEIADFFYDKYGQRVIGIILKKESKEYFEEGDMEKLAAGIKKLGTKMVESVKIVKN